MNQRLAGILLPLSSVPDPYGIGTMGSNAYQFIDYLKACGQSYWQILPLGPTSIGDSPYQTFSTFAGSPYYINLEKLISEDLITTEEAREYSSNGEKIDYGFLFENRLPLLHKAFERYQKDEYLKWQISSHWVFDYALFMSLKEQYNMMPWYQWPDEYKYRNTMSLQTFYRNHSDEVHFWIFLQYLFFEQWNELKSYAKSQGIEIIGDIPLYVAHDSVEVWTQPNLFDLDGDLMPNFVAGYPKDAFSDVGQLWGNPLYLWQEMKKDNYKWWLRRLKAQNVMFDLVRIDHFLGFEKYWAIPYGDSDALQGHWEEGPKLDFFKSIMAQDPFLKLIAEDLGNVTDSVREMRRQAGLPSMRVLQFGFTPHSDNENLPHHYGNDVIAYTGTHDVNTILGWWNNDIDPETKDFAKEYLNLKDQSINEALIRALYQSGARIAIVPMQDLLCEGSETRINLPNTMGNWTYRLNPDYQNLAPSKWLYQMSKTYRRLRVESI